jgi:hypothetical protein
MFDKELYDEFDVAIALDHWLQHNWNGINDPLYAAHCELTAPGMYRPAMGETFDDIESNAREVYDMLTVDNYREALDRVLNYRDSDTA